MTPATVSIIEFSLWSSLAAGILTLLYFGYREALRLERTHAAGSVGSWNRQSNVVAFGRPAASPAPSPSPRTTPDIDLPNAA